MIDRQPNEVWMEPKVLGDILAASEAITDIVVERGPLPAARIVGIRWDVSNFEAPWIVVVYDQPVDEPVLKVIHR